MSFHVGQKVVCINGSFTGSLSRAVHRGGSCTVIMPKTGETYTIRGFHEGRSLYLEEIVNPVCISVLDGIMEPCFKSERFRPLIEKKTDISVFTEMLTPKQLERVDH